ncbi:MAG: hypothetical protein GY811_29850 [Myxococcales bacterium]|nr:hypothetical protein [Myxococcales bacterium]
MGKSKKIWVSAGAGVFGVGLAVAIVVGTGAVSNAGSTTEPAGAHESTTPILVAAVVREAFEMPECTSAASEDVAKDEGNPIARRAAQRGLKFLSKSTASWQERNNCYGCHVQAVTLEALAVGKHNQYEVDQAGLDTVLKGMLDLPGGARHATGLGHDSTGAIYDTGKIFGVAALARYDQWVAGDLEKELTHEAGEVLKRQLSTGELPDGYTSNPVAIGKVQATAQALVAWRQVYERSADDKWLIGISKAEDYLRGHVSSWKETPSTSIQEINYAIMGLIATGMSSNDKTIVRLGGLLRGLQTDNGGWPMHKGGASEPYSTGQALYTLRLMGSTDKDEGMSRGIHWLVERQKKDGSWSEAGFGKAEAMWGVLGLVSMDVLTLAVQGVKDGQHVSGLQSLAVEASDNKGTGVVKVELLVDDLLTYGSCGSSLSYNWDTATLVSGKHVVDVRATNAEGKTSRRRFEVYAGDVYMTQLGSSYVNQGTELALRSIAERDTKAQLRVEIFESTDETGKLGKKLFSEERASTPGPMRVHWDGKDLVGNAQDSGSYVARFSFVRDGKEVQVEDMPFVHDTPEAQMANFAQIGGSLALPSNADAANAEVELIDGMGNVVQSVRSTKKGRYRFRNIKGGKDYSVRVRKQGFKSAPMPVRAEAAAESEADFKLEAE